MSPPLPRRQGAARRLDTRCTPHSRPIHAAFMAHARAPGSCWHACLWHACLWTLSLAVVSFVSGGCRFCLPPVLPPSLFVRLMRGVLRFLCVVCRGWGGGRGQNGALNGPHGLAKDVHGNVFVADAYNQSVPAPLLSSPLSSPPFSPVLSSLCSPLLSCLYTCFGVLLPETNVSLSSAGPLWRRGPQRQGPAVVPDGKRRGGAARGGMQGAGGPRVGLRGCRVV
jgi:hypothetical protein